MDASIWYEFDGCQEKKRKKKESTLSLFIHTPSSPWERESRSVVGVSFLEMCLFGSFFGLMKWTGIHHHDTFQERGFLFLSIFLNFCCGMFWSTGPPAWRAFTVRQTRRKLEVCKGLCSLSWCWYDYLYNTDNLLGVLGTPSRLKYLAWLAQRLVSALLDLHDHFGAPLLKGCRVQNEKCPPPRNKIDRPIRALGSFRVASYSGNNFHSPERDIRKHQTEV